MTKSKLIRSTLLLLLALVSLVIIAPIAFLVQTLRHSYFKEITLETYYYKLALSIDYLGATVIFGTVGRTVSSLVYEKQIRWAVSFIDWIFYTGHCEDEYNHETKNKHTNIYQDEYGV